MTISSVTKDGGYLVIVEDGVTTRRSIVYEDTVCSKPPDGYEEVGVIYVNHSEGKLVIHYNGESIELDSNAQNAADVDAIVLAHAILPTVHQNAPALISTHANLPTAHQNAPQLINTHAGQPTVHQNAPALISTHAALPTVHQNAPQLISDHAGLPTVHQNAPALIETHAQLPTVHQNAPALIATHAAIKAANATLGHVIVETGSLIDVDGDGKLTLGSHASTHQNSDGDEINVGGLSGELADRQLSKTGDSTLGWTDEKLLIGAGAGNAPDEIDMPAGFLAVLFFQFNPGTGDFGNPQRLNDNNTATIVQWGAINQYAQVLFSAVSRITQWRQFGDTQNINANGRVKLQYLDLDGTTWVDWVTGITPIGEAWSSWDSSGGEVIALGIKMICTTYDVNCRSCGELEVKY